MGSNKKKRNQSHKKKVAGRQQQQRGNHAAPPQEPAAMIPPVMPSAEEESTTTLTGDKAEQLQQLVNRLVEANAIPEGYSESQLSERLKEILFVNPYIEWLTVPAVKAMLTPPGGFLSSYIWQHPMDTRVPIGGDTRQEAYPLIHWFSQWKLLRAQFVWAGGDDMVEIALKLGANPNATIKSSRVTPMFLAVKYGSLRTVRLFQEFGCNLAARDKEGITCLFNALEHPNMEILVELLDHLPATECFTGYLGSRNPQAVQYTMVDRVLSLYTSPSLPVSWKILGPPPVESLIQALFLLLDKGVSWSPVSMSILSVLFWGNKTMYSRDMKKLAGCVLGEWLPPDIRDEYQLVKQTEILQIEADDDSKLFTCPICFGDYQMNGDEVERESVTLYCGHVFCVECLLQYAAGPSSSNQSHDSLDVPDNSTCPVCRRILCPEISSHPSQDTENGPIYLSHLFGNYEYGHRWGPHAMTDSQVVQECNARGISTRLEGSENLREKLEMTSNTSPNSLSVDLGATQTMIFGNGQAVIAPKDGRIVLPISIKGVPILAFMSSKSPYTVLSPGVCETFGIAKKDLVSKEFCDFQGKPCHVAALESFHIKVGSLSVTLNRALQLEKGSQVQNFGIQLGWDFLHAFAYTCFDVEINASEKGTSNNKVIVRVDGMSENATVVTESREEFARFYGRRNGEFCSLPIYHLDPYPPNTARVTTIGIKERQKLVQCYWCCRIFPPKGMIRCEQCESSGTLRSRQFYYCDKLCQESAKKIHHHSQHQTSSS